MGASTSIASSAPYSESAGASMSCANEVFNYIENERERKKEKRNNNVYYYNNYYYQ